MTAVCPDYRVRLFLSVDIVGSTAFKAKFATPAVNSPEPVWVKQIQEFYREFPRILEVNFEKIRASSPDGVEIGRSPSVWKTIGDEIIFCCRLQTAEHLSVCFKAFMRALSEYGGQLAALGRGLDAKGAAWIAPFPALNVTVDIKSIQTHGSDSSATRNQSDEIEEAAADVTPGNYDFLGQHIDAGFRSAKLSSSDNLSISVELSYLLLAACEAGIFDGASFRFFGRQTLKGVISDRPYPMISIDMERSLTRRTVLQKERDVTGNHIVQVHHLSEFVKAFMLDEGLEFPVLPQSGAPATELPVTYAQYKDIWTRVQEELREREEAEDEAFAAEDGDKELPPEVEASLEKSTPDFLNWLRQPRS